MQKLFTIKDKPDFRPALLVVSDLDNKLETFEQASPQDLKRLYFNVFVSKDKNKEPQESSEDFWGGFYYDNFRNMWMMRTAKLGLEKTDMPELYGIRCKEFDKAVSFLLQEINATPHDYQVV